VDREHPSRNSAKTLKTVAYIARRVQTDKIVNDPTVLPPKTHRSSNRNPPEPQSAMQATHLHTLRYSERLLTTAIALILTLTLSACDSEATKQAKREFTARYDKVTVGMPYSEVHQLLFQRPDQGSLGAPASIDFTTNWGDKVRITFESGRVTNKALNPSAPSPQNTTDATQSNDDKGFVAHIQSLLVGTWNATGAETDTYQSKGDVLAFDGKSTVTESGVLANQDSPTVHYTDYYRKGLVTYVIRGTANAPEILITGRSNPTEAPFTFTKRIASITQNTMTLIEPHPSQPDGIKTTYKKISGNPRFFYQQPKAN